MSRKKLNSDQINERLLKDNRDIQLIGEYLGALKKSLFKCGKGHEWLAIPSNVLNGNGCMLCRNNNQKSTKSQINNRLLKDNRDIQLIGEYLTANTKSLFECGCGYQWMAIPNSILQGRGCRICSNKIRTKNNSLTTDSVSQRLHSNDREILLIGQVINGTTKTMFGCSRGHKWMAIPHNVLNGSGCPECTPRGFNPKKSAAVYLLHFGSHIKYGISNKVDDRLDNHKRNGEYETLMVVECSGEIAWQWERMIKKKFGGRFVDKFTMPDGWTETLSPECAESIIESMIAIQYLKSNELR